MSGYGVAATDLAKQSNLVEGPGSSLRDSTSWILWRPSSSYSPLTSDICKSGLLSSGSWSARA
jgi:hypothetical protein